MQTTPPVMPAQAAALMASKGYSWIYNGAWQFTTAESRNVWDTTWQNFMPRVGVNYRLGDDSVMRFGYARFQLPIAHVRETLGAFVDQYTGYAQNTSTLGLSGGRPQQVLSNPYPVNNPVIEPYGQSYGAYTGLGGPVSFDHTTCGRRSTTGSTCPTRSRSGAASWSTGRSSTTRARACSTPST